jgi:hypothetical protein
MQDLCFPAKCADPSQTEESQHIKWAVHGMEAGARVGLDLQAPLSWPEKLRDAGFVDIHVKWYNWPVGKIPPMPVT